MAATTAQCPICQDDLKDPRLLPCIHSFCLVCLEAYCMNKLPGDDAPCPICRNDFQIPKNGVANLPVRKHARDAAHSATSELDRGSYCEKHDDERIKMYCFDCNVYVCPMCCLEMHKTHKFEQTERVIEEYSKSIDDDIKQITSRIEHCRGAACQLEAENKKTLDNIKTIELEVKERCKEIRQLVDRHESDLLQELQSLRSAVEEEVESHTDTLHLALAVMESFKTGALEMRSKGSLSYITEAADVHERAKELLQTCIIPSEYCASSYKFTPGISDNLLRDDQNFIGHVVKVEVSGNIRSY